MCGLLGLTLICFLNSLWLVKFGKISRQMNNNNNNNSNNKTARRIMTKITNIHKKLKIKCFLPILWRLVPLTVRDFLCFKQFLFLSFFLSFIFKLHEFLQFEPRNQNKKRNPVSFLSAALFCFFLFSFVFVCVRLCRMKRLENDYWFLRKTSSDGGKTSILNERMSK